MLKVAELKKFVASKPSGTQLIIATSKYTSNVIGDQYTISEYSTPAACRSVVKAGLATGESLWRCFVLVVA